MDAFHTDAQGSGQKGSDTMSLHSAQSKHDWELLTFHFCPFFLCSVRKEKRKGEMERLQKQPLGLFEDGPGCMRLSVLRHRPLLPRGRISLV